MDLRSEIGQLDIDEVVNNEYINWEFLRNSSILVTGATGLIGSLLVNSIIDANKNFNLNITILALVRNKEKAVKKFGEENTCLKYIIQDIIEPIKYDSKVDFIIHTANTTTSKEFVEKPVETINSIYIGTDNILKFATKYGVKSVVYLSSMEVYGQTNFENVTPLKENEYGYIDILKPRSSYPEAKRLAECLCANYYNEFSTPVKIGRLVQTVGAEVDYNDNRVFAQYARNIVENKDIVLHTKGESTRNMCYVTDAVSAIFKILEKGINGDCYNIANEKTTCSVKEMAEMLCLKYKNVKLKIDLENSNSSYYSPKTRTVLNNEKLKNLGWEAKVSVEEMFERLITNFKTI